LCRPPLFSQSFALFVTSLIIGPFALPVPFFPRESWACCGFLLFLPSGVGWGVGGIFFVRFGRFGGFLPIWRVFFWFWKRTLVLLAHPLHPRFGLAFFLHWMSFPLAFPGFSCFFRVRGYRGPGCRSRSRTRVQPVATSLFFFCGWYSFLFPFFYWLFLTRVFREFRSCFGSVFFAHPPCLPPLFLPSPPLGLLFRPCPVS